MFISMWDLIGPLETSFSLPEPKPQFFDCQEALELCNPWGDFEACSLQILKNMGGKILGYNSCPCSIFLDLKSQIGKFAFRDSMVKGDWTLECPEICTRMLKYQQCDVRNGLTDAIWRGDRQGDGLTDAIRRRDRTLSGMGLQMPFGSVDRLRDSLARNLYI